ncbi:MAG: ATP-dependent metallopeptidase FtsH/Yme1/Tma family protein [Eubacteriaceae bacterium]
MIILFIITVLLLSSIVSAIVITKSNAEELSYNAFIEYLESGEVKEVNIKNEELMEVTLEDDTFYIVPNPEKETMKEFLLLKGVNVTNNEGPYSNVVPVVSVVVILTVVLVYYKKAFTKDKLLLTNVNSRNTNEAYNLTFESIAGNEEAKYLVKDIIDFIKDPEKYSKLGANMPKGILLYGPPGTGKTLMAKAIAGESEVPFYAVSGSDFVQMYVGVGASRIRQLFNKAKKSKKAVIFIDEIDAIGKKRSNGISQNNDERDQTLNALLTEMSGFMSNQGIVVIAATNRLDTLDEALIRPGRFDRMIEIGLPDIKARYRILKLHLKNKPLKEDLDIEKTARETVYFSGAMLENLANEAAIIAANNNKLMIYNEHLDEAFFNVIAGSAKKDRSTISVRDKNITAYHEGGHALATKVLMPENIISKVTIIPSTRGYGGFSMSIPKDGLYKTKLDIINEIKVLLAGRVAEELIFGSNKITTGASNDIEKASIMLKEFIIKFGMDEEFGIFNYEAVKIEYSKEIIDKCRKQMKNLYEDTKGLINENIELLHIISKELIKKETLNEKDIDLLFIGKTA